MSFAPFFWRKTCNQLQRASRERLPHRRWRPARQVPVVDFDNHTHNRLVSLHFRFNLCPILRLD
jgi:hypothetical protein